MKAKSLFFAALAIMIAACVPTEDPKDEFVPEFKVSGVKDNTISVGASGKDVTISVTANVSWNIDCKSNWITVETPSYTAKEDKTSETVKVTVSVYENEEEEAREDTLTIAAVDFEPVKIAVKQAAKEPVKEPVNPTIAVLDGEFSPIKGFNIQAYGVGEDVTLTVSATADWKAEFPDWVTLDPATFTYTDNDIIIVTVTISPNEGAAREGVIVFKGDFEKELKIPVSQASIPTIGLKLGEVTQTSAAFTTTPSDKEQLYMIMCENKSYVDDFETDEELLKAELEYFADVAQSNEVSLETVINTYANQGDIDDAFDGLRFDSDYVLYAYCITLDGKIVSKLERFDIHTPSYEFTFSGTAVWHDVAFGTLFDVGAKDLPCDVYTVDGLDGHYFFYSPFNYANLCGWFVPATPAELFPYKDEYTKDVYIEIDCSDPAAVVYPMQETGLNVNDEYGWMLSGCTYGRNDFPGTYSDGTITFDNGYVMVIFPDELQDDGSVGGFYGIQLPKYGVFTITIDFDATESVYPKDPEVTEDPEVPETSTAKAVYKPAAHSVSNQFAGKRISKRTILK